MLSFFKTDSFAKLIAVSSVAALMLAGCGGSGTTTPTEGQSQYEVAGDHAIGNPDAAVTIVEYASVVCGACYNWHTTVFPDFKEKYIDSGKVRFVFREFPTPPEDLARAGFLIANCADDSKFFENIGLQFKRQRQILTSADRRQEYINIAKSAGLSEDEFVACMSNEEEITKYENVVKGGIDAGVTTTPTFFINGEMQGRVSGKQLFTLETFDEVLEPLLTNGVSAPESAPATEDVSEPEPTEQ